MKSIDTKEYHVEFGKFIKEARECKKMNQTETAELVGITQSYLSYLESGDRDIDLALALKLCDAVGADMKDFISKLL